MAREKRRRRYRGRAEIAQVLGELESSGLTQRSFAESRGIPLSTLSSWIRRQRSSLSPALIPVRLAQPDRSQAPFEVWLRGGRVVRIPADFDPEALGRLLQAIESC